MNGAVMAQRSRPRNGMLLLLAGAALLLLLGRKPGTGGGGAAVPGGSLSTVDVSQDAPMGAHAVAKRVTPVPDNITISASWTPATTTQSGQGIPWDYQLRYEIHAASGPQNGVMFQSGFLEEVLAAASGVGLVTTAVKQLGNALPANGTAYHVTVILEAKTSSSSGSPMLPYVEVGRGSHLNAFTVEQ